jgi:hypothetical protein
MVDSTTSHTWMTRPANPPTGRNHTNKRGYRPVGGYGAALRPRAYRCRPAKAAPRVLDPLGPARPQSHLAVESTI